MKKKEAVFLGEKKILSDYLSLKGYRETAQRERILDVFMENDRHMSAEELFLLVKKKDPSIGIATVFRALKIFVEAGIAEPVEFSDKTIRYEHKYDRKHHDHLICVQCGNFLEFFDAGIEKLQKKICKKNGFIIKRHRLDIFGICPACQRSC